MTKKPKIEKPAYFIATKYKDKETKVNYYTKDWEIVDKKILVVGTP